jgi:ubiquinone/menaquinone biosynthesis C-methylase UbiE
LCESAPSLRAALSRRFADVKNIEVLAPENLPALPDGALDLVVVNSVLQYLTPKECADLAAALRPKLSATGRLILADVIPPDAGMAADVSSLLGNAWRNGFFLAALGGLAMTVVSDYRRLRQQLGLTTYKEEDIRSLLRQAGFDATRRARNFGFNQQRMTVIAQPAR